MRHEEAGGMVLSSAGEVMAVTEQGTLLTQRARDELLKAILRGQLTASDRLVVTDLASKLEMSRTPVRDALKRLAVTRVVTPNEGSGYRVVEPTMRDIRDLVDLLLLLEPRAATDAARLDVPQRSALADRLDDVPDDGGHAFHVHLGRGTTNQYVTEAIEALNERLATARATLAGPCRSGEDHRAIVQAIRAGQPDQTEEETIRHLLRLRAEVYGGSS